MDSERLASLTAELKGQLWLMEKVNTRLCYGLDAGLDTPGQLDSIAYQIHNLYCSVEDLLKLVAKAFENNIGTVKIGIKCYCSDSVSQSKEFVQP